MFLLALPESSSNDCHASSSSFWAQTSLSQPSFVVPLPSEPKSIRFAVAGSADLALDLVLDFLWEDLDLAALGWSLNPLQSSVFQSWSLTLDDFWGLFSLLQLSQLSASWAFSPFRLSPLPHVSPHPSQESSCSGEFSNSGLSLSAKALKRYNCSHYT